MGLPEKVRVVRFAYQSLVTLGIQISVQMQQYRCNSSRYRRSTERRELFAWGKV